MRVLFSPEIQNCIFLLKRLFPQMATRWLFCLSFNRQYAVACILMADSVCRFFFLTFSFHFLLFQILNYVFCISATITKQALLFSLCRVSSIFTSHLRITRKFQHWTLCTVNMWRMKENPGIFYFFNQSTVCDKVNLPGAWVPFTS